MNADEKGEGRDLTISVQLFLCITSGITSAKMLTRGEEVKYLG